MRAGRLILYGTIVAIVAAGGFVARSRADGPRHDIPKSKDGKLVVGLCDGETTLEVAGVKEGETMARDQAQQVSDQLMEEWRRKNPDAHWDDAPIQVAKAGDTGVPGGPGAVGEAAVKPPTESVQEGIYSDYNKRDERVWMAATDQFVKDGHRIFHDANAFGGTIGVSCDMCHPDAANTHPETYPKFQVQLGKVAMLRDMINWCIENPARGKPLHDDDVRLKAMEAYIIAQRKGIALDYGKH